MKYFNLFLFAIIFILNWYILTIHQKEIKQYKTELSILQDSLDSYKAETAYMHVLYSGQKEFFYNIINRKYEYQPAIDACRLALIGHENLNLLRYGQQYRDTTKRRNCYVCGSKK
jgi:hypothetical protein